MSILASHLYLFCLSLLNTARFLPQLLLPVKIFTFNLSKVQLGCQVSFSITTALLRIFHLVFISLTIWSHRFFAPFFLSSIFHITNSSLPTRGSLPQMALGILPSQANGWPPCLGDSDAESSSAPLDTPPSPMSAVNGKFLACVVPPVWLLTMSQHRKVSPGPFSGSLSHYATCTGSFTSSSCPARCGSHSQARSMMVLDTPTV